MKNVKTNFKDNRITSGVGIAIILVIILKVLKVDIEGMLGMGTEDIILYLGAAISALLLLIARDPD